MKSKFSRVFAALVVAIALMLPMAGTVAAADYDGNDNLAGRPIRGTATDWCQGMAYGRINGQMVLFTSGHCYADTTGTSGLDVGDDIYNSVGVRLGVLGDKRGAWDKDLGFIWLADGKYPSTGLNKIFRGDNEYWTITQPYPSNDISCDNIKYGGTFNSWPRGVYHNFQTTITSNYPKRYGGVTGFSSYTDASHCTLQTNLEWHGPTYADSGSSFILTGYGDQVFAGASSVTCRCEGGTIQVTPVYSGIHALDNFWEANGNNLGAYFCADSTCTAR